MKRVFTLSPGIAAYLGVTEVTNPGIDGPREVSAIFMSHEKGVIVGMRDTPMAQYGWPPKVQAEINAHFKAVFDLAHEEWKGPSPSPRARYCDAKAPWTVEVEE